MLDKLDESTFLLFAAKHYNNPQCYDTIEFYEDLKRFKYIKRLLTKYINNGELRERLILNHIISLNNVFGPENTSKMLFFKLAGYEKYLKPFLLLINILPEKIYGIGSEGNIIYCDEIQMDAFIIEKLREIDDKIF